jgi:CubicO group peptidase (beta-lactamase class C family)
VNCKNYLIALLSLQSFFYAFANAQVLQTASPNVLGISTDKATQLNNELNSRVTKGELPGAVLMVIRNQKIAIHEAIGFRDIADKSPMQKDSIFRIASMTKPITTAAALQQPLQRASRLLK